MTTDAPLFIPGLTYTVSFWFSDRLETVSGVYEGTVAGGHAFRPAVAPGSRTHPMAVCVATGAIAHFEEGG